MLFRSANDLGPVLEDELRRGDARQLVEIKTPGGKRRIPPGVSGPLPPGVSSSSSRDLHDSLCRDVPARLSHENSLGRDDAVAELRLVSSLNLAATHPPRFRSHHNLISPRFDFLILLFDGGRADVV